MEAVKGFEEFPAPRLKFAQAGIRSEAEKRFEKTAKLSENSIAGGKWVWEDGV
jgi:hypothetical protein